MGETVMLVLVLLLALYGCMELIRRAAMRIMRPSVPHPGLLVLPLGGHCDDVEYRIRSVVAQTRWTEEAPGGILLLLLSGIVPQIRLNASSQQQGKDCQQRQQLFHHGSHSCPS